MDSKVIHLTDGFTGTLGLLGVRSLLPGLDTAGHFSLVEHPMPPRALGAPLHRHSREDEVSIVLEGEVGAMLGDDVMVGRPGEVILKPRAQWHAFWNAGDAPARLIEIISPAGFEHYFRELIELGGPSNASPATLRALYEKYGLEMDRSSVPMLTERFGLRLAPVAG
ncbi:MAG TPA: cupin domain-containing protein [Devosia sp.]|nr:cupin domain-containing protein [Devosia sp.]